MSHSFKDVSIHRLIGRLRYTVYFINNTGKPIESLKMSTGCILNADNDVIQSDISQETIFMLSGKDYLVIECLDDRDFDSDIWYSFELVTQSKNIKLQFVINKYKKGLEKVNALMSISKIPVIDKPGEVVFPTYS